MRRELDPAAVQRMLAIVAESYVPETVEQGLARLRADARSPEAFRGAVERRLEELRALDDLARVITGVAKKPR
jgi:hypothetical protein